MQSIIDFIRNHPIYLIDALVIGYAIFLIRKKTQQDRQTQIAILKDSISAANQTKSEQNVNQLPLEHSP
jgi:hypothetical protein